MNVQLNQVTMTPVDKQRRLIFTFFLMAFMVAAPGCDQSDPSVSDARITEDGVDGVKFGDTIIDIRRILGDPQVISHIDGQLRSWYGARYLDGDFAGLTVYSINIAGQPDTTVPVDAFVIRAPHPGMTVDGIRVGSSLDEVVESFGPPELVRTPSDTLYYFCMGARDIQLRVKSDTVATMSFGFYEPLEGWYTDCSGNPKE